MTLPVSSLLSSDPVSSSESLRYSSDLETPEEVPPFSTALARHLDGVPTPKAAENKKAKEDAPSSPAHLKAQGTETTEETAPQEKNEKPNEEKSKEPKAATDPAVPAPPTGATRPEWMLAQLLGGTQPVPVPLAPGSAGTGGTALLIEGKLGGKSAEAPQEIPAALSQKPTSPLPETVKPETKRSMDSRPLPPPVSERPGIDLSSKNPQVGQEIETSVSSAAAFSRKLENVLSAERVGERPPQVRITPEAKTPASGLTPAPSLRVAQTEVMETGVKETAGSLFSGVLETDGIGGSLPISDRRAQSLDLPPSSREARNALSSLASPLNVTGVLQAESSSGAGHNEENESSQTPKKQSLKAFHKEEETPIFTPEAEARLAVREAAPTEAAASAQSAEAAQKIETRTQVITQTLKHTERMAAIRGSGEIDIHLMPEHLGKLHIRIIKDGENVIARISAESQQVQQLLESGQSQLKNALKERGLNLQTLEFSSFGTPAGGGGQFSQAFTGSNQSPPNEARAYRYGTPLNRGYNGDEQETKIASLVSTAERNRLGRLDFRA